MSLLQISIDSIIYHCTILEDSNLRFGYDNKSSIDDMYSFDIYGESIIYPSKVTQDGKTYTITEIGAFSFQDCNAHSLEFPSSINKIHPCAFKGSLAEYIDLSKTEVLIIPEYCFQDTFGEVILPDIVQTIGIGAYDGSWILDFIGTTEITEIGFGSFQNTIMLCTCDLSKTKLISIPPIFQESFVFDIILPETLITIEKYAFAQLQYPPKKFSGSLINIEDYAFYKSVMDTKVSFYSTSLMSIGSHAFDECKLMEAFLVPKCLTYIGDFCFANTPLINFEFTSELNYLGNFAFNGSRLTKANLEDTALTEIGTGCFDNNQYLSVLKFPNSLKVLNPILQNNNLLELITVTSSVETLSDFCFANYLAVKEINLNETKVTYIPNCCFMGCKSLLYITLPIHLESINATAFQNATSIMRVMSCGDIILDLENGTFPSTIQLYTSVDYINSPENVVVSSKCSQTEASTLRYWGDTEEKVNVLLIIIVIVSALALIIIIVVIIMVLKRVPISSIVEEDFSSEESSKDENQTEEKEHKKHKRKSRRPKIVTTVPTGPHYLTTKASSKGFEVAQYSRNRNSTQ